MRRKMPKLKTNSNSMSMVMCEKKVVFTVRNIAEIQCYNIRGSGGNLVCLCACKNQSGTLIQYIIIYLINLLF